MFSLIKLHVYLHTSSCSFKKQTQRGGLVFRVSKLVQKQWDPKIYGACYQNYTLPLPPKNFSVRALWVCTFFVRTLMAALELSCWCYNTCNTEFAVRATIFSACNEHTQASFVAMVTQDMSNAKAPLLRWSFVYHLNIYLQMGQTFIGPIPSINLTTLSSTDTITLLVYTSVWDGSSLIHF